MIRLLTFGSFEVIDANGRSLSAVAAQAKRAALLTYLALARSGTHHRRDHLLGLFWPELNDKRGRAALNQALTFLRREISDGLIDVRGRDDIGLVRALVRTDVEDFDEALERGDFARSLTLYRGDFLEGFHVADAPDVVEWIDSERDRLRDRAVDAAIRLARLQISAGHVASARESLGLAIRLSPLSEVASRELMTLEAVQGNRAAAVAAYESLKTRMQRELEVAPDAETEQHLRDILAGRAAVPAGDDRAGNAALPAASAGQQRPARRVGISPRIAAFALGAVLLPALWWSGSRSPDRVMQSEADDSETVFAPPARPEAYDAWVAGMYEQRQNSIPALRRCIDHANEALRVDSVYAAAHYLLALCHSSLSNVGGGPPRVHYPAARRAATRALELDNTLADAYFVLAWVRANFDWDWAGAESAYVSGLRLKPNSSQGRHSYGWFLAWMGRFDEAVRQKRLALDLEPVSPRMLNGMASVLVAARRYDQAIQYAERAVGIDSTYLYGWYRISMGYSNRGQHEKAIAAARRARALDSGTVTEGILGMALAAAGRVTEARATVEGLARSRTRGRYASPAEISQLWSLLGEVDSALVWLERAADERDGNLVLLKVWPPWDALREHDRFARIMRRMKLPQS